ncbi:MAG: VanZ family protein [Dehalococcoidia bacterium]
MKAKYYLFFTIIWMIFIFFLSNQSGEKFEDISHKIEWLKYQNFFAHFILYFILGFFFINFLRFYIKNNFMKFIYYFLFILFYSIFDEIHQYYVPGRYFEIMDIFVNIIGALALFITFISKSRFTNIINNE